MSVRGGGGMGSGVCGMREQPALATPRPTMEQADLKTGDHFQKHEHYQLDRCQQWQQQWCGRGPPWPVVPR